MISVTSGAPTGDDQLYRLSLLFSYLLGKMFLVILDQHSSWMNLFMHYYDSSAF